MYKLFSLPIVKSGVLAGVIWKLYSIGNIAIINVSTFIVISLVNIVENHWRVLAIANSIKLKTTINIK